MFHLFELTFVTPMPCVVNVEWKTFTSLLGNLSFLTLHVCKQSYSVCSSTIKLNSILNCVSDVSIISMSQNEKVENFYCSVNYSYDHLCLQLLHYRVLKLIFLVIISALYFSSFSCRPCIFVFHSVNSC